jgi:hypothetical protein
VIGDYLSPAAFRLPRWVVDSAWLEHAPFAFWLVETQRPQSIVELGTYLGYSYATFCEAVELNRLGARCVAIDTWEGDEHATFYGEHVFRRFSEHHNPLYGTFSRLLRSTFDDAVDGFADSSIDLLHIDGRHFYEDVRHDFETWRPKLSPRAIVLFHDTQVRDRGFGVHQLWAEVAGQYPHFEFHHGHGLGVLGVGRDQEPGLAGLYAAGGRTEEARNIRKIYAHLGQAITLKVQIEKDRRAFAANADGNAAATANVRKSPNAGRRN